MLQAAPLRHPPSLNLAANWHADIYAGVAVPSSSYVANPRDSDPAHPDLIGYEVQVGAKQGLPSSEVPAEMAGFETALVQAVTAFDQDIGPGQPLLDRAQTLGVVELASVAHGEWVRIHPYANGNGRTARLWATWVAVRYGLPPFIHLKPRPPGLLYARAATASMGTPPSFDGDHMPTVGVFLDMLANALAP